jgi:hypothetical protein
MQALMTRFGGHPYDEMDLLPFNVVDPVKRTPLENLWGMGYNRNELVRGWRCWWACINVHFSELYCFKASSGGVGGKCVGWVDLSELICCDGFE